MIVLGIDTSGATASAAVWRDGRIIGADSATTPRAHGSLVTILQQRALAAAGVGLGEVSLVAVAVGPGLFTGLRVGVVAAAVLGWARAIPVVGVGTLHAIAARVDQSHRPQGDFVVAVDARRSEVFMQAFLAGPVPVAGGGPSVARPAAVAEMHAGAAFVDSGAARLGVAGTVVGTSGLATEVAGVAGRQWPDRGLPVAPVYLRRPDVTVVAK